MEPDPLSAKQLLYTVTYYATDLIEHFNNAYALNILKENFNTVNIEEYPKQSSV